MLTAQSVAALRRSKNHASRLAAAHSETANRSMRVLLNVPKKVRRGEAIEVKILISHPMESGQRRDEMGKLVPRQIIHDFRCTYNGVEVLSLALFPAIAANPFLSFAARAEASGTMAFSWVDDAGVAQTETADVEVE